MSDEVFHGQEQQLSFLSPSDAMLLQRLYQVVAEVERIYTVHTPEPQFESPAMHSPADVYAHFRPLMAHLPQEQVRVANLTVRHHLISSPLIYQGTLMASTIRVAELFRPAILDNAASIIVAHNHPSGDPEPSADDYRITSTLVEAGNLLQIPVLDHIVVARRGYVSLAERGRMHG